MSACSEVWNGIFNVLSCLTFCVACAVTQKRSALGSMVERMDFMRRTKEVCLHCMPLVFKFS